MERGLIRRQRGEGLTEGEMREGQGSNRNKLGLRGHVYRYGSVYMRIVPTIDRPRLARAPRLWHVYCPDRFPIHSHFIPPFSSIHQHPLSSSRFPVAAPTIPYCGWWPSTKPCPPPANLSYKWITILPSQFPFIKQYPPLTLPPRLFPR